MTPASVALVLTLQSATGWCHGTPIAANIILTASHCADAHHAVFWSGQDQTGKAYLAWSDTVRDLAILIAVPPPSPPWHSVPIAAEPPGNGAALCWRVFLPEHHSVGACGSALGTDDKGDLDFWGPVEPGSSGSGLVTDRNELVGVVTQTFNPWVYENDSPHSVREAIHVLGSAVSVMSISSATPVDRLSWRYEQTVKVAPAPAGPEGPMVRR